MASIASFMTWAAVGTSLKSYLGISATTEDARLQLWLAAFAAQADSYCDGTVFSSLPPAVELAVYSAIETFRARRKSSGLTAAGTKDLSEDYAEAFAADAAFRSARELLRPWKTSRFLDGR